MLQQPPYLDQANLLSSELDVEPIAQALTLQAAEKVLGTIKG
ncbi:MAG: hypothetical protein WBM08_01505 [Prochlorococcaceae cyanobacterium]